MLNTDFTLNLNGKTKYRRLYHYVRLVKLEFSVYLYIHPSVNPSVFLSACPSLWLSVYLSFSLFILVWLSVCVSIYLSCYISICLFAFLSVCQSICLSIHPHIHPIIHLITWFSFLSVCLCSLSTYHLLQTLLILHGGRNCENSYLSLKSNTS